MENKRYFSSDKILFKEVTYKNKTFRFFLLIIGEIFIAITVFIVIQLVKSINHLANPTYKDYLVIVFFVLIFVLIAFLLWGSYLMQNEVIINKIGISMNFRIPPLIKRNRTAFKDEIKSVYWFSSNHMLVKNGKLLKTPGQALHDKFIRNQIHQLVIDYSNKKSLIVKITNPDRLEKALFEMFNRNRS